MKRDGVNRMFPFAKRGLSECGSIYEPKITNRGVLIRFAGNSHVYQATKYNFYCFSCNWSRQSTVQCVNRLTLEFFSCRIIVV